MKRFSLLCALSMLAYSSLHADEVAIDVPLGGWRLSTGDDERYLQEVHYPAVQVSVDPRQATAALIRGHIAAQPKAGAAASKKKAHSEPAAEGGPGRLIINGAAMPISVDGDGNFARPYAFGPGSNGVEMRAPAGGRQRVQFYQAQGAKAQSRIRVILSWDSDGTDLDLHVISPSGQHTWYGERVSPGGAALDVDVTTGYGPEIYSNPAPEHGTYLVYVNYYGSGENRDAITIVDVTVITDENLPSEKKQFFRAPMRKPGELTLIHSFVY